MPSSLPRLRGALDNLFSELEETAKWEREIADEARRAASRRERLTASLQSAIIVLDPDERAAEHARLRKALGQPRPAPIPAKTRRVRLALDWLARRDPPEFALADLAAHLQAHGHSFGRGYLSALLGRWTTAGAVTRLGQGRWRVNREAVHFADCPPALNP